jgi:hypothetical protein
MAVTAQSGRTLFSGTNIATANYIYNASLSTAATSGWVSCRADTTVVEVCIATLNAAAFSYRIEGKFNPLDRAASVYADEISSAQEIGQLVNISQRLSYIRVGAKIDTAPASPLASPNNFYCGILNTELS